jgi:hypothetical protein
MKFLRLNYIAGDCTKEEYYSQYVSDYVKQRVIAVIGKEALLEAPNGDMNSISIALWRAVLSPLPVATKEKMSQAGEAPTMCAEICIAKAAAVEILQDIKQDTL